MMFSTDDRPGCRCPREQGRDHDYASQLERKCVHVHVHASHNEHDPGHEGEQGGEEEDEVGSGRVASPSPKLVCTQDEAANPTTSLVLPIPSELRAQDEDGGIPPPSSSSSLFPALDEAAGSHRACTLPQARNTMQEPHHIY